jgi:hypothetical protein
MAFKLLDMAQLRWRRLDGVQLLPLVRAGAKFVDGVRQDRPKNYTHSSDDQPEGSRLIMTGRSTTFDNYSASNDARVSPLSTALPVVRTGCGIDCRPLRGRDTCLLPGYEDAHRTIASYCRAAGIRCHLCRGIAMRCVVEPIGPGVPDTSRLGRL